MGFPPLSLSLCLSSALLSFIDDGKAPDHLRKVPRKRGLNRPPDCEDGSVSHEFPLSSDSVSAPGLRSNTQTWPLRNRPAMALGRPMSSAQAAQTSGAPPGHLHLRTTQLLGSGGRAAPLGSGGPRPNWSIDSREDIERHRWKTSKTSKPDTSKLNQDDESKASIIQDETGSSGCGRK